jgi:ATP-binding cassette subfamily B (MDR/TAP) protein 1
MDPQNDVDLEEMWAILFQNVIGSLVYAMVCIRPNITEVVGFVSQFMANLGQSH